MAQLSPCRARQSCTHSAEPALSCVVGAEVGIWEPMQEETFGEMEWVLLTVV